MGMIPYQQLRTIFLDVGGTLVAINFDWICAELRQHGIECEPAALQRAEAAARPVISSQVNDFLNKPGAAIAELFLIRAFEQLPSGIFADHQHLVHTVQDLLPVLFPAGKSSSLWSYILPGVPEALYRLHAMGLQLVVVSNSDGSVEQLLETKQLRYYFDVVIDSHVVGVEKPDPRIFEIALERSGAKPDQTLHVGDFYHFDVVGARAAGIHPLLLDPYGDWPDVDCDRAPDVLALCDMLAQGR